MKLTRTQRLRLERLIDADTWSKEESPEDRRNLRRVPVRLVVTVLFKHDVTHEYRPVSLSGRILNLSKGGAMIAMEQPLTVETIFVRFLSDAAGPHVIQSRLAHSSTRRDSDHPYVYGIEFQRLLSDDQFADLLQSRSLEGADSHEPLDSVAD